jgi:hypothetical protein
MQLLNLNGSPRTQLPASAFPKYADAYLCDECGREITKYLHRYRAHSWPQIGRERYLCRCGQSYFTGAKEWDHITSWKRRRFIKRTLGLSIVLSVLLLAPGILIYWIFHRSLGAAIAALVIVALPFILQTSFWLEVAASKRRTSGNVPPPF